MSTLARIATGTGDDLLHRAADVQIKERRRLVLVPRETPLAAHHLEHMSRLAAAGAVILPAMPGFYHRPTTVAELVDFVVQRVCDQLGVAVRLAAVGGAARRGTSVRSEPAAPGHRAGAPPYFAWKFEHVFALPSPDRAAGRHRRRPSQRVLLGVLAAMVGAQRRDGLQPARRPRLRRPQPAHGRPAPAGGQDRRGRRRGVHDGQRGRLRAGRPQPQPPLLRPGAGRARGGPGLLLRQAVHALVAPGAGAGPWHRADGRVARAAGRFAASRCGCRRA
jgi:hypothetical protein